MRRFLVLAGLVAVAVLTTTASADARHHRGRIGLSFNFGFPAYYPAYPYYPAYYPAYYPPRAVYAAPAYAAPPAGVTLREGRDSAGNYCREYQTNTIIEGRPAPSYGTACLRPDGQWQIVN